VVEALIAGFAYFASRSQPALTSNSSGYDQLAAVYEFVIPLALWLLIAGVMHDGAIPGHQQFWLTRPYSWRSLLRAKILFILAWVCPPDTRRRLRDHRSSRIPSSVLCAKSPMPPAPVHSRMAASLRGIGRHHRKPQAIPLGAARRPRRAIHPGVFPVRHDLPPILGRGGVDSKLHLHRSPRARGDCGSAVPVFDAKEHTSLERLRSLVLHWLWRCLCSCQRVLSITYSSSYQA
jgi:hypothetical protein